MFLVLAVRFTCWQ